METNTAQTTPNVQQPKPQNAQAHNDNIDLWTEKLRPKRLKDVLLVPRIRQELENGVVDNILLYGRPGSGKTTLTRILCEGYDCQIINASLERGIDSIRDKVVSFASTISLMDNMSRNRFKIIVLEECDNLTADAWKSLRAVIEQYHNNCRFIANCNYIEKIPDPIKSRLTCIAIEPQNKEEEDYLLGQYIDRVRMLLTALRIEFTEEALVSFVRSYFPDMRSIVKKLHQLNTRHVKSLTAESLANTLNGADLFDLIIAGRSDDPYGNYTRIVKDYGLKAEDGILEISKNFVEYMHIKRPELDCIIPEVVSSIATHVHQLATALDKLITLLSLICNLQMMITAMTQQLQAQGFNKH